VACRPADTAVQDPSNPLLVNNVSPTVPTADEFYVPGHGYQPVGTVMIDTGVYCRGPHVTTARVTWINGLRTPPKPCAGAQAVYMFSDFPGVRKFFGLAVSRAGGRTTVRWRSTPTYRVCRAAIRLMGAPAMTSHNPSGTLSYAENVRPIYAMVEVTRRP
jgi:hypothetical protein